MKNGYIILLSIIAVVIIFLIAYNNKTFLINRIVKTKGLDKEQIENLSVKELQKLL